MAGLLGVIRRAESTKTRFADTSIRVPAGACHSITVDWRRLSAILPLAGFEPAEIAAGVVGR